MGSPAGTKGYKYSERSGLAHGVVGMKLVPGVAGKAKLQVKAKGASMLTPQQLGHPLPLAAPAAKTKAGDTHGSRRLRRLRR